MNTHTKRFTASFLVALLALSLSPNPIGPAAADDAPVQCWQYYTEKIELFEVVRDTGVPYKTPCENYDDTMRPAGQVWTGLQADENGDGMGDRWQQSYEANLIASIDTDLDGLTNLQEFWWLSNPLLPDSDGDGWTDGPEAGYWSQFAPGQGGTIPGFGMQYAYPAPAAFLDTDGDLIPNILDADSDEDGLHDGIEEPYGARPELSDTDDDGLIDGGITSLLGERVIGEVYDVGSLPGHADSDGEASPGAILFRDDFNDGTIDSRWTTSGASESANCGHTSSPRALYFSGTEERSATVLVDATRGGEISFTVRHGTGTGGGACDKPEPEHDDDLALEYSTGGFWTRIATFEAGMHGSWGLQSVSIPGGAHTVARFRWVVLNHAGLVERDHWAIDDVVFKQLASTTGNVVGDGLSDREEYEHWTTVRGYAGTMNLDTDGDGVINILDVDSDGDGAFDGREVQAGTSADDPDTDGDRLPDGWEIRYNQPAATSSASQDTDADGASAEEEYCYGITLTTCRAWNYFATQDYYRGGTRPDDADTDDDLVLDGEEMTAGTDPHWWDTDADGMPDEFELQYGFDPLDAADAALDADNDLFDQDQDGTPEQVHDNLAEYQYGRPAGHNEVTDGPWQLGTVPTDPDSDNDGSRDAQEVYFGTDPRVPADLESDDDQDGLNWTAEANLGTDPNDADTDGDGLCDGGRAQACTFPGLPGVGHPGEGDYGSVPWMTDSDEDGIPDGVEATQWDPEASGVDRDVDGDLVGGITDAENDGDELLDGEEAGYGTRMDVPDTDGDGLTDGAEVFLHGTAPTDEDTDGDGLVDGAEVLVHGTQPLSTDTDMDGLSDGAEVLSHGTNPLAVDTDADGLPDEWEVTWGTQPAVADGDVDAEGDGLNNLVEYQFGSGPLQTDTDGDTLPDGWEYQYDFHPRASSQNLDSDVDGSLNGAEYQAGTNPRDVDTDADGLWDGAEATHGTLPLVMDTDADGLLDGAEVHTYGTKPLERDTDRDGLSDYDEVFSTKTDPLDSDTDNDGLSDYDEVFVYQGLYDPNNPDTDGDGQDDGLEVALSDPDGDVDRDGLTNGQEAGTYGTEPGEADSDCDGIQDGAEVAYWQIRYSLTTFKPYLWNADVDGDGIKDGIEIGTAGTPQQALYRTRPDRVDTDNDGLWDDQEAVNNVRASCGQTQTTTSSSLPEPVPGVSLNSALRDATGLAPGVLYEAPDGVMFGVDEEGVYIQGGYGVRLYPPDVEVDLSAPLQPLMTSTAAGTNGRLTDPQEWDTDGDGLSDGAEIQVYGTNPVACDSDNDGLGDGLEVGKAGRTRRANDACTHRDAHTSSTSDPLARDTDGDGLLDGQEDANANGRLDVLLDSLGYCGRSGSETDAQDMDTDDDGMRDLDELNGVLTGARSTSPFCFDTDGDGLSDGLEIGLKSDQLTPDTDTLRSVNVYGYTVRTWQPSATGLQLNPNVFDFDADGIPDGLEDLDADGRWGLAEGEMDPSERDTDGDRIVDGRELLLYGLGNYQVPFAAVMKAWGGSLSGVNFDAANPFETNPLNTNTDAHIIEGNVPDGLDLNPRGDALVVIDFGKIRLRERPDHNDWWAEIYVSRLNIDLPFTDGDYSVGLSDSSAVSVYTKGWNQIPETLVTKVRDKEPSTRPSSIAAEGFWTLRKVDNKPILKVNLPDSGASLNPADQTIAIDLWLKEDDRWSADNPIDLNRKSGASNAHHEFRLGEIIRDAGISTEEYLGLQRYYKDHTANDDRTSRDEDGALKLRMGDNVHEFFLQTVTDVLKTGTAGVPSGTCFSQTGCI